MHAKLSSLSAVIPVYNDEESLPILTQKLLQILPNLAKRYELIIINDASSDRTLQVAYAVATTSPSIYIINHKRNRGYGGALLSGFRKARYDYVFYTDGDGQYDVFELPKLVRLMDKKTEVVSGYKISRSDSLIRTFIGSAYNWFVKLVFRIRLKDVDCDFRLLRRKTLLRINLSVKSGAFDAAFVKSLQEKGAHIREVGVHHYPRMFGPSQFFSPRHVLLMGKDILALLG